MRVTLIIPAYNEAKRLTPFLKSIVRYYQRHRKDITEIVVVDDGSTDATAGVAHSFVRQLPLRVVSHPRNLGKGAAVCTGVSVARGDYIIFMDADGATDISELPKMLAALGEAPIGNGNRWMRGAVVGRNSITRRLASWVYRTYLRLFGLKGVDTMCGFKGYQAAVARDLFRDLQEKRWLFDTEIAYKALLRHYATANFPIHWQSKDGSKLSLAALLKSAWQIWPLIRRTRKKEKKR